MAAKVDEMLMRLKKHAQPAIVLVRSQDWDMFI